MSKFQEIPQQERPREKAMREGIQTLSNQELLAILLRTGTSEYSVMEVAHQALSKSGGLTGLSQMDHKLLCEIPGISRVKALEIESCMKIAKRIARERVRVDMVCESPNQMADWLRLEIGAKQQEHFMVVYLDHANHVIDSKILFVGTLQASMVSPREIIRYGLIHSAAGIILAHNHPSGSLQPSQADIQSTRKIQKAARLMDIQVLDHIIVSKEGHLSLLQSGYISLDTF